jgi:hypothetical protein
MQAYSFTQKDQFCFSYFADLEEWVKDKEHFFMGVSRTFPASKFYRNCTPNDTVEFLADCYIFADATDAVEFKIRWGSYFNYEETTKFWS